MTLQYIILRIVMINNVFTLKDLCKKNKPLHSSQTGTNQEKLLIGLI